MTLIKPSIQVREARPLDVPVLLELIRELARFEKAEAAVSLQAKELQNELFGPSPLCFAWVAELDQEPAGFLLGYYRFSTWKGRMLYVEDIYIKEEFRRKGIGKKLMDQAIQKAKKEQLCGLTWQVLDWNQPAIDWYTSMGAELDGEWINVRLFP